MFPWYFMDSDIIFNHILVCYPQQKCSLRFPRLLREVLQRFSCCSIIVTTTLKGDFFEKACVLRYNYVCFTRTFHSFHYCLYMLGPNTQKYNVQCCGTNMNNGDIYFLVYITYIYQHIRSRRIYSYLIYVINTN